MRSHVEGVTRRVDTAAERLGLEEPIRDALVLAARLHDSGKIDPRFQAWMNGGTPPPEDVLLAKSGRAQGTVEDRRARVLAGWPEGMRHESRGHRSPKPVTPVDAQRPPWAMPNSRSGACLEKT